MKSALALLPACLALLALTQAAVAPDYLKKITQHIETCAAKHGTTKADVLKMLAEKKAPETQEMKCTIDCYMTEAGFLKDGQFDWDAAKATHEQKYVNDPESLEKANKVSDICKTKVSLEGKKECEIGEALLPCFYEESKTIGLEAPDFIKEASS